MLTPLIAFFLSFGSCTTCSVAGRDVTLCETHANEERAALTREKARLGSKDPAVRRAALDAIAALTEAHANAPSPKVAEHIAACLDDESFELRKHAAGLLVAPQHASASLDGLVAALASSDKEWQPLNAEYDKLAAKLEGKLDDKRRAEMVNSQQKCNARRKELGAWRQDLIVRVGTFSDDRAVNAILEHSHRNLLTGREEVLVRLGNRKAIRALLESFKACDRDLAAAEKQLVEYKAERAGKPRIAGDLLAEMALDNMHKQSVDSRAALQASFAERGLKSPEPGAGTAAWTAWIDKNVDTFPAALPGVNSPVW